MTEDEGKLTVDGITRRFSRVTFETEDPFLLKDEVEPEREVKHRRLDALLFVPDDEERQPAMVVSHGLGGVKPERELTYGHKLAQAGHVALVPDGFAARDLADADDKWRAFQVSTWTLVADAFAALRFLRGHPRVDPDAVSIMGFSWGGMVSVLTAYEQIRRSYLKDDPARFAGHVSLYGCSLPRLENPQTTRAPVLVMVGAKDTNVSVPRTKEICEDLRRGGSEVHLHVLDGYHQWDGKDHEKRHVIGSLADIRITVRRDGRVIYDALDTEVDGPFSQALGLLHGLRYGGYHILRDPDLHRQSDTMLFDFLAEVARRENALPPDTGAVTPGAIAETVTKPGGDGPEAVSDQSA